MSERTAAARRLPESADASPWHPMSTAPQGRPILLKARWNGRNIAIVGSYQPVHGAFVTPNHFGQGEQVIYADAWCEIPNLEGDAR